MVVLTGARIPYAMARDGVFFHFAERIHPSFRTPSGALIFLGSHRCTARTQRNLRRAVFALRFRRLDLLRLDRDRPAAFTP